MKYDLLFSTASSLALAGWVTLALAPRWPSLIFFLRFGMILSLSLAYAALIFVAFFRIENGGFASIADVRALFLSDPVLVAGWIHYLAFDLFIGTWIAVEADRRGIGRLMQLPVLAATFLFGPLGFLLFSIIGATQTALSPLRNDT